MGLWHDGNWYGLDQYVLLRMIHAGRNEVWLAAKPTNESYEAVALKVQVESILSKISAALFLRDGEIETITEWDRAESELNVLKSLQSSSHIVKLLDVVHVTEEIRVLVLEYGHFQPLYYRDNGSYAPSNGRKLNEKGFWKLSRELVAGVKEMKLQNICHRDLKPENLIMQSHWSSDEVEDSLPVKKHFVDPFTRTEVPAHSILLDPVIAHYTSNAPSVSNEIYLREKLWSEASIKIIDFNLARVCDSDEIFDAEGTNLFTPPEAFSKNAGSIVGSKRDLWSIGVILFAAIHGQCPFWHETPIALQLQVIYNTINFDALEANLSTEAVNFLRMLLSKNPSERLTIQESVSYVEEHFRHR